MTVNPQKIKLRMLKNAILLHLCAVSTSHYHASGSELKETPRRVPQLSNRSLDKFLEKFPRESLCLGIWIFMTKAKKV